MRLEAGEGGLEGVILGRERGERGERLRGDGDGEGEEAGVAEEAGEGVVELGRGWSDGVSLRGRIWTRRSCL